MSLGRSTFHTTINFGLHPYTHHAALWRIEFEHVVGDWPEGIHLLLPGASEDIVHGLAEI